MFKNLQKHLKPPKILKIQKISEITQPPHLPINNYIKVRQASIYGLGLLVESFPKLFLDKSGEVLEICAKLFAALQSAGDKAVMLRENAAAAYARVAFACAERVALEQSFPVLLSMLPLQKDLSEVCKTTDLLLGVVEACLLFLIIL